MAHLFVCFEMKPKFFVMGKEMYIIINSGTFKKSLLSHINLDVNQWDWNEPGAWRIVIFFFFLCVCVYVCENSLPIKKTLSK